MQTQRMRQTCLLVLVLGTVGAGRAGEPGEPPEAAEAPPEEAAPADPWAQAEALVAGGPARAKEAEAILVGLLAMARDAKQRERASRLLARALYVRTGSLRAVADGLQKAGVLDPLQKAFREAFKDLGAIARAHQIPTDRRARSRHPFFGRVGPLSPGAKRTRPPGSMSVDRPRRLRPDVDPIRVLHRGMRVERVTLPDPTAVAEERRRHFRLSRLRAEQTEWAVFFRHLDAQLSEARKRRSEAAAGLDRCRTLFALPLASVLRGQLLERAWSFYAAADPRHEFTGFRSWARRAGSIRRDATGRLALARVAAKARDYRACLALVEPLLQEDARSLPQDECLLLAGTASARLERIPDTFRYLQKLVDAHPRSDRVPRALLLLAWAHLVQHDADRAAERLHELVRRFPRDRNARPAQELLKELERRAKEEPKLF